jgi:TPR repeat protein
VRLGASHQFIARLVGGDVLGALNDLKKQAIAGDPTAINVYGDFTYWNCFVHRSPEQLDSYAAMQMQESRTLPATDAEWFREAFMEDIAFEKAVVAACSEVVNVDQAFDMVDERAKQGDSASLWLASMTVGKMAESQQLLRAAAIAGSADAQFEIAFVVLGGHQQELLGTGPDGLDIGDLLRQSAEQIPQAEGNLATCEFYGCAGIVADPAEGVRTALSAAEHGFSDALFSIGPHLTPSQLDSNDVEAWKLIQASVELQCGGSWSNVKAMKATLDALSSPAATDAARQRADQLLAQYGAELGC